MKGRCRMKRMKMSRAEMTNIMIALGASVFGFILFAEKRNWIFLAQGLIGAAAVAALLYRSLWP